MNEAMKPDQAAEAAALRQSAEEQLQSCIPSNTAPLSADETRRLLHELQVHQIELEMQNEELRSSRAQLETAVAGYTNLYDFAPAGYFTLDRNGEITQTNLVGARLLGLERAKLSGKRFGGFVVEADIQIFSVFLQHVFTKQHHTNCEVALMLQGRSSITVQIEATLSPNERECHAVVLDITERKRAEDTLRETKQFINSIIHFAQDIIVFKDNDFIFRVVNPAMCNLVGKAENEIIGKTDFDIFPYELAEKYRNDDKYIIESGQSIKIEEEVSSYNGVRYVSTTKAPVLNENNACQGIVIIVRDITEHKQAQEALLESEARWEFAVDGSALGLWDWNIQTNGVFFSKQWKKMIGFEEHEISGNLEEWEKRIHPEDKAKVHEDIQKHFGGKTTLYQNEHRVLCKDNSHKWILARGKIIAWTDEGKPLRMIGTHTDITETKQFEIALQRSHDELEARVRERTLDLQKTYEQLLHAEKMSSIGKLSASIAHEFNNSLQGVTSIVQGIKKRTDLDHDDTELVDLAIKECHRMRDLIKSLQDFNRPTSARKAPMDIHTTLESIYLLCKKEYTKRKISITTKYAENLPQIMAVSDQFKQVFLNLLDNASDACVQGGNITIETDSVEDNVVIRVHDTGCGIRPDDREYIFDPFFTTKAGMKGTGLGLPVSYGIVKAHGGEISVESKPGKGTIFSIVLPIKGGSDEEK